MHRFISGGVVICVALCTMSCGGDYDAPVPPAATKPTGDEAYDKVQPVLAANCLGCHGVGNGKGLPTFETAAKFKASKAKDELTGGDMPPAPKSISAGDKQTLLTYLGS